MALTVGVGGYCAGVNFHVTIFSLAPTRLTVAERVFVSGLRVRRYGRYCRGAPPAGSGLVHIYYISITRDAILRSAAVPILYQR